MNETTILIICVFVAVSTFGVLVSLLLTKRANPIGERVGNLSNQSATNSLTSTDAANRNAPGLLSSLLPTREEGRQQLGDRLIQAGLYRRNSVGFYVVVKVILFSLPIAFGLLAASAGLVPLRVALFFGALTGLLGTIIPSFWLDAQKRMRQTNLRRALPDAVDVIVICVEAGLSLPAALARVSKELATAHPMLATEMTIVQREIQMGCSTGEALKRLADRFDLEELRSLASVTQQAEKFGASIVKALRVHADALRVKRFQRAEEKARQATVKLLFPTVFFIFPALFVVLIGPAAFDLFTMIMDLQDSTRAATTQ